MEMKVIITGKGTMFSEGHSQAVINDQAFALVNELVMFFERKVKEKTPRGVGGSKNGLYATIYGEPLGRGTPIVKGIIAHSSGHGDVIEKGRTAGKAMPPAGSLISWIALKIGATGKEAKRIEYLIRRKIGKKGFEGAHMFEKALNENWLQAMTIAEQYGFSLARELSK